MSGFAGCTRTREICCVSARPTNSHFFPPSVVLKTPSPCETLPRIGYSPVPTYTTSGFDSLTPIPPIVPPKYLSVTGSQVLPPSAVLNTPPPVVPIQYSFGRDAEPATATERPPRKMPISRHFSAANTVESYGVACAEAGRAGERTVARATTAAASGSGRADTRRPPGEWTRKEAHVARKRRPPQGRRGEGRRALVG